MKVYSWPVQPEGLGAADTIWERRAGKTLRVTVNTTYTLTAYHHTCTQWQPTQHSHHVTMDRVYLLQYGKIRWPYSDLSRHSSLYCFLLFLLHYLYTWLLKIELHKWLGGYGTIQAIVPHTARGAHHSIEEVDRDKAEDDHQTCHWEIGIGTVCDALMWLSSTDTATDNTEENTGHSSKHTSHSLRPHPVTQWTRHTMAVQGLPDHS